LKLELEGECIRTDIYHYTTVKNNVDGYPAPFPLLYSVNVLPTS